MMFRTGLFHDLKVLVVGDVMLDRYWFGEVERISPEAPVPIVKITEREERPGGAANVANNVAELGALCTLLSVIGEDEAGGTLRDLLADSRIDVRLALDREASTTVKLRIMSRNQQLLRTDFEAPPSHELLAGCLASYREILPQVDAVVVSDYGKGGLVHLREMITQARAAAKPLLVDPKGRDFSRYRDVTALTPNLQEFEQVVGTVDSEAELTAKAQALVEELNLEMLLVTRSNRGMSLVTRAGEVCHSPARAREVYDVSGAGDTVIGAFTLALLAGFSVPEQLHFANTAAGVVVAKLGAATVTEEEVVAALRSGAH